MNIPTIIRRAKTLPPCRFERWGEDAIRRFSEIDAKSCNARMIGGGSWERVTNGRDVTTVGKCNGVRGAVMSYLGASGAWRTRAQIIEATGYNANTVSNALNGLSVKKLVLKRLTDKKIGQWKASERAKLLDWEKPKERTNRQIAQLSVTASWQTTKHISEACGLSVERTYKALSSLAAGDIIEKRKVGEGFDVEMEWRRIGATREQRENETRETIAKALHGRGWVTTPAVADLTGFSKGRAAGQLARLLNMSRVENRTSLINGRHTKEWRLLENEK